MERHVLELSIQLVKRGHTVDVYTSDETRGPGRLGHYSEVRGIPVRRFKSLFSLGEFGKVWPGFACSLLKRDYDVIHAHSYRHPHTDLAAAVSKLKGSRSVMTSHSPFHPPGVRAALGQSLVPVYDKVLAPMTLRAFDRIVSLTPAEAERLASLGAPKDRIVEISHGVGPENFTRCDCSGFKRKIGAEGKEIVLYLGRINRTKGIDVLLEAFALVSRRSPSAMLVVAGPATSPEEVSHLAFLEERARALRISDRVFFTGKLSEEEKQQAYEACRFFVLPSLYEPYGIVLLEAAAHGKPLISTFTDGPGSVVRDGATGFLVGARDAMALAEAMGKLLADDKLVESMSEEALKMARTHSWESVAALMEGAYLSI